MTLIIWVKMGILQVKISRVSFKFQSYKENNLQRAAKKYFCFAKHHQGSARQKYRDEIYSLQILLSRTQAVQAEQLSKSRKKFHHTTYKD